MTPTNALGYLEREGVAVLDSAMLDCIDSAQYRSTTHYRGRSQLNTMSSATFWCAGDL